MDASARILDVATKSFAEVGFGATSTAGVAREAGVTQPLVHHHFGSKDGLWRACVDRLFADMLSLVRDTDTNAGLIDAAVRFIRLTAARPEITAIITREAAAPSARLTYLVDTYLRVPMQMALDGVKRAQKSGKLDRTLKPEMLLLFIIGAVAHPFNVPALCQQTLGIDVTSDRAREGMEAVMTAVLQGVLK